MCSVPRSATAYVRAASLASAEAEVLLTVVATLIGTWALPGIASNKMKVISAPAARACARRLCVFLRGSRASPFCKGKVGKRSEGCSICPSDQREPGAYRPAIEGCLPGTVDPATVMRLS